MLGTVLIAFLLLIVKVSKPKNIVVFLYLLICSVCVPAIHYFPSCHHVNLKRLLHLPFACYKTLLVLKQKWDLSVAQLKLMGVGTIVFLVLFVIKKNVSILRYICYGVTLSIFVKHSSFCSLNLCINFWFHSHCQRGRSIIRAF